jgi:hypothetical protein
MMIKLLSDNENEHSRGSCRVFRERDKLYIFTVVTTITKLKRIIGMASIDDDKIVFPSRT